MNSTVDAAVDAPNVKPDASDAASCEQQANSNNNSNSNKDSTFMMAFAGQFSLPTPQLDTIQSQLRRNSMPNPDVIGQHITNIIDRNSAIVGEYNPWFHRKSSSGNSQSSNAKQSTSASNQHLDNQSSSGLETHKNQFSATNRKRWSTHTSGVSPTLCQTSGSINKTNINNSVTASNTKTHNKLNNNTLDQYSKKLSTSAQTVASKYSAPLYRNQRKLSLTTAPNNHHQHHHPHHMHANSMSQEQLISNTNQTLAELAKLDTALRGVSAIQDNKQQQATNNNNSPNRYNNDNYLFDPFTLSRHNTLDAFNLAANQQLSQQQLMSSYNSSNAACNPSEQQLSPGGLSDASSLSFFQNHIANKERSYDSADCSNNKFSKPNDRRYSLNSYSIPPAYQMGAINGLDHDSSLFSDQITSYTLWKLRLEQLAILNQQACYKNNHLADSFLQLDNPFMTQKDENPMILNQNLNMDSQSFDSINSNLSINTGSSPTARDNNHPIDYRETSSEVHQPNPILMDQHALKVSQELDEALIRDFLTNLQNNNNRILNQYQHPDNDHFASLSNGHELKNVTDNSLENGYRHKTIADSISNNEELLKDFSYMNNHHQTFDTPSERKAHLDINTNPIHICKLCGTIFRNLDTLMAHQAHYCSLSDPINKLAQDLMIKTPTPSINNDVSSSSQKTRRNSSALGDLADKVRNVFVTATDLDQPINLNYNVTSPRRVSKSISPTQLSSRINSPNRCNINSEQTSICTSPTSSIKNQNSILKQQLLGSCVTPAQSLPPKKRKISEPNLKLAGFHVGQAIPMSMSMINRISPDSSLLRRNDGTDQGMPRQVSCENFNSLVREKQLIEPCELDLSNKKGSKIELSINDEGELDSDDFYGSDICNISKKQCYPTRNTQSLSSNVPLTNGKNKIHLEGHKSDLTRHLDSKRNFDYMPHVLDVSARKYFPENLQLPTFKANSE